MTAIGLIVSAIILLGIVATSMYDADDLKRLQLLKNKKRFGGKRLPLDEAAELDALSKKYWWF